MKQEIFCIRQGSIIITYEDHDNMISFVRIKKTFIWIKKVWNMYSKNNCYVYYLWALLLNFRENLLIKAWIPGLNRFSKTTQPHKYKGANKV